MTYPVWGVVRPLRDPCGPHCGWRTIVAPVVHATSSPTAGIASNGQGTDCGSRSRSVEVVAQYLRTAGVAQL